MLSAAGIDPPVSTRPVDGPTRVSVDAELDAFITQCANGLKHQVGGDPEPLIALWSDAEDVAVLGAVGSYARGPFDVRAHLRGAARTLDWDEVSTEPVLTSAAGDMAVTVTLEHMRRQTGEPAQRTLRTTQGYRRENGRWRLFLRHANAVTEADIRRERALLAVDGGGYRTPSGNDASVSGTPVLDKSEGDRQ